MNTSRIAVIFAVVCIGAWTLKALAMGFAGGSILGPLVDLLFLLGFVSSLVAAVFLGLTLSSGRSLLVRVLASLATVIAGVALSLVSNAVVESARPADDSWVWGEINLWIFAAVLLTAAVWARSHWHARAPH